MKRRRLTTAHQRPAPDADAGVLPLINIVFLLLIFFMVAGKLTEADPFGLSPARSLSERQEPEALPILHVSRDGALVLDGTAVDRDELRALLSGRTEVRLKIDARHAAPAMLDLLKDLKRAGIATVSLITELEPGA